MSRESKGAGLAEPPVESGGESSRAEAGAGRETPRAGAEAPRRVSKHSVLREYFESLVVTAVMALFGMTFVVQAVKVPTGSMQNTILIGDHLLVNKFIFAPGPTLPFLPQREIRRGDIVVFKYPAASEPSENIVQYKTLFIKRVVGLPGETVEVKGADVYIDGKILPEYRVTTLDRNLGNDKAELKNLKYPPRDGEPYAVFYTPGTLARGDNSAAFSGFRYGVTRPYEIPAGQYFLMGDNRDNSKDSRYWGSVPRDLVVGRAMFVIWSYDESAPHSDAPVPFNFVADFLRNTRWGRFGTLLR
jgi:signal peptidase I